MVVVFLDHFFCADVELDDLLVGHTGKKFVLHGGVKSDNMRDFTGCKSRNAGACFRVPELHLSVI